MHLHFKDYTPRAGKSTIQTWTGACGTDNVCSLPSIRLFPEHLYGFRQHQSLLTSSLSIPVLEQTFIN
jgi:hypothetical protein